MNRWVLLCAVWAGQALAAPLAREEFIWRMPLTAAWTNGGLYRVLMSDAALDVCAAFPSDLRILDDQGGEWPFLVPETVRAEAEALRVSTVAAAELELPSRHMRFEVRVDAAGGLLHHRAALRMAGRDFVRRVEVWGEAGGEAGARWELLGDGYVLDRNDGTPVQNRMVGYATTGVARLQFRIFPSPHAPDEPLLVQAAAVYPVAAREASSWRTVEAVPLPPGEQHAGALSLGLDLGARNLRVIQLHVEGRGADFVCPVKVYGRNQPTNSWRWLADGGVHRIAGQTRDTIPLQNGGYRYLRLDLFHHDQPAPEVAAVQALVEAVPVVFEAGVGTAPHLYAGAERIQLPRYDLARRRGHEVGSAVFAEAGRLSRNPHRLARMLGRYGRTLGWALVGTVAALVLAALFRARLKR